MRKIFTSLIVLLALLGIAPVAAWANAVPISPFNSQNLLSIAVNTNGTGTSVWNGLQLQFNGVNLLAGLGWNSGSWNFSTNHNLIVGSTAGNWNSTLYLTMGLLPRSVQFSIDVFQFNHGTLLTGATTQLTWNGQRWSATNLPNLRPISVPEPHTLLLMGITALVAGVMRKKVASH